MKAEQSFRAAFIRLKTDAPLILPKGTPVSQNNVAREAGSDPSALRKSRYPSLIQEIQDWIGEISTLPKPISPRQTNRAHIAKKRDLREKLQSQKMTLDHALAMLIEADATILDLAMEVERLRAQLPASNVVSILRD